MSGDGRGRQDWVDAYNEVLKATLARWPVRLSVRCRACHYVCSSEGPGDITLIHDPDVPHPPGPDQLAVAWVVDAVMRERKP